MVPFRAGDWKCGSDNCGYHNFAKNVSCLRCGASRAGAAVVADTAFPSPVDAPSYGAGMGLGGAGQGHHPGLSGPAGLGHFGAAAGGAGVSGFPGQGGPFGAAAQQQSNFGLPSSVSLGGGFPQMNALGGGNTGGPGGMGGHGPQGGMGAMGGGVNQGSGHFDHRAEQAFSGAGASAGNVGGPNGGPQSLYSGLPSEEAFSFLSGGLAGLGLDDDRRKQINGGGKSPAV